MAALVVAMSAAASTAQEFPHQPVTMIVPFAAGGAGRKYSGAFALRSAAQLSWGKLMVIENKPGAGGIIGAVATAKAEPDGYTLMIAPSAIDGCECPACSNRFVLQSRDRFWFAGVAGADAVCAGRRS